MVKSTGLIKLALVFLSVCLIAITCIACDGINKNKSSDSQKPSSSPQTSVTATDGGSSEQTGESEVYSAGQSEDYSAGASENHSAGQSAGQSDSQSAGGQSDTSAEQSSQTSEQTSQSTNAINPPGKPVEESTYSAH